MDCAERPASARSTGPSRNNHPPFNSLGTLNKPVRPPLDETDISSPHGPVIRNNWPEQCRNFGDRIDISDNRGNSSPDAQNAPPLLHSCITMISPSRANQRLAQQFIFHDAASKQNGNYSYSGSSVTSSNYSDISLSPNCDETKTSSHGDSHAEGSTATERDDNNWERRKRNTDATRKSREKKRFSDMAMEQRLVELTKENNLLKNKLEIQQKANSQAESVIVAGPSVLMSSGLPFPTLDAAALNPLSLGSTAIATDEDSCNNTNFECAETKDSSTRNDTPPRRESNGDTNKPKTPNSSQENLNSDHSPMDLSNASPKYVPPFSVLMPRYLASDSFPLTPTTLEPSNEQEKACTSMGTPFSLSNLHAALQQHAALIAINNQHYRPPFGSLLSSLPPHTSSFLHHPLTAGMPLMHPGSSGVLSGSHPSAFQPFTAMSVSSSKSNGDSSNIERPAILRMNVSGGRGSALGENHGNQKSAPDSSSDKIVQQPLANAGIDRSSITSTLLAPQPMNSLRPSVLSHIPASKSPDPPSILLPNLAPLLSNPHYTHPQSQLQYISRPSIFSNGGPSNIQTTANGNQSRNYGHMPSLGSVLMMNQHATSDHLGQSSSKFVPNFLPPNGSGFNFATNSGHHVRSRSIAGSSMLQNSFPGVSEHNQQPHSLLGTLLSAARRSPSVPESRTEKQSGLVELKDEKHKQSNGNLSPFKSESDRRNKSETCKRRHSCHTGEEPSSLAINQQTSTSNTASASTSSYMNVSSGKSDSDEIHSLGSPNSTDSNRSRASSLTTACATNGDHHTSLGRTTGSSSATNSVNGDMPGIRRSSSPSNASVDDLGQHHFNASASTSSASPSSGGTMNIHGSGLTNEQCDVGQNTMRPDLERYMDRRRRNNEAAKRCRANRRAVFEYRSRRAQQLEIENGELRQEMLKLHNELEQLKAIIAANGRILQPAAS